MRQLCLAKQSIGKCGRVAFIDKANRAVRYMIQPRSEITGFNGFLTFAAIAMDWQTNDPAKNLILTSQVLEVLLVERAIFSRVRFQRARPSPAWITDGHTDPNCTIIDASKPAGLRPIKLSCIGVTQTAQPREIPLKSNLLKEYSPHIGQD